MAPAAKANAYGNLERNQLNNVAKQRRDTAYQRFNVRDGPRAQQTTNRLNHAAHLTPKNAFFCWRDERRGERMRYAAVTFPQRLSSSIKWH